jgi:acetyl-CoA carboxylase biotin carboxyl carrier protein
MALFGFELEEIARLIALVEAQGLDEFIFEEEGRYLRVRGLRAAKAPKTTAPESLPASLSMTEAPVSRPASPRRALPPGGKKAAPILTPDQIVLESPMMGVFYRAEKPGAPPLVNVGDRIAVGQTVGVLEAMKVFSEFKADYAGVIASIPARDGELVQAGAPLFYLRKE